MKAGILIGHLSDTRNESALIRTAEAMGINQIHIVGRERGDIHSSVARGAERHVSIHRHDSHEAFCESVAKNNQSIVPIENTMGSVPIEEDVDYPTNPVFVTGNEGRGVPEEVLNHADVTVRINQSVSSYMRCLNTTVAGSIVMHDWFRRRYDRDKRQHEFASGKEILNEVCRE